MLSRLERQAKRVVVSGHDRKWDERSKILQRTPEMRGAAGRQRKLLVFSEHRDTLDYQHDKIAGVPGNHAAIVTIHGGTHRDERRRLQALLRSDPDACMLVATTVTVTRNEILYASNQGEKFVLAIVLVNDDGTTDGPYYLRRPFDREPDWGVASVNHELHELLRRSTPGAARWT